MITLSSLTKVTDGLPEIGTKCLVYSMVGGYTVAVFTDKIGTVGRYKSAWFCKSGRQMSKKTVVGWVELTT
jgi:hypothetical protein